METKETKKIPNVVLNTIVKTFKANERFYNDLAKAEARLIKAQTEVEQNKAFIEAAEFAVMEITKKYSPNGKAYKSCDLYEWIQVPSKDENGNIKYKEDGTIVTRKTPVLKNENIWPVEVEEVVEETVESNDDIILLKHYYTEPYNNIAELSSEYNSFEDNFNFE